MGLTGAVQPLSQIDAKTRSEMFALMDLFYCRMERLAFDQDLDKKDFAVLLYDEQQVLRGFTTQQLLWVDTPAGRVRGMFSGDTIIHRDFWGSMALFQTFARFYFQMAEEYPHFYWFLICKGHKTYRLLPLFFHTFYPRVGHATPPHEQATMDAYARLLYPKEYDHATGVLRYRREKDALRPGVADITDKERKNPHVRFFEQVNPGYVRGDDLVCLTRFTKENLRPGIEKILLGGEENAAALPDGQ